MLIPIQNAPTAVDAIMILSSGSARDYQEWDWRPVLAQKRGRPFETSCYYFIFFAKNRYTWSLWCQKQGHSKTKYKSHARSPAIGQPHIVPVFGLKGSGTPGFVYFV